MKHHHLPQPRVHRLLTFQIIGIYYVTLFGLLFWAVDGWGGLVTLSSLAGSRIFVIQLYYYVIPLALAAIFGFLFRPFWAHFRNLLLGILILQAAYSFVVYCLRYNYVQVKRTQLQQSRLQKMNALAFRHRFLDKNHDGLVDAVQFAGYVELPGFQPGEYFVRPVLTQKAKRVTTAKFSGNEKLIIAEQSPAPFFIRFEVNPQDFADLLGQADFELNLALQKSLSLDSQGRKLLVLAQWSPYLRTTSWIGEDLDVQDMIADVDYVARVDAFSLLPLKW